MNFMTIRVVKKKENQSFADRIFLFNFFYIVCYYFIKPFFYLVHLPKLVNITL